jgi:SWIM/SEC-C metal-binding protein
MRVIRAAKFRETKMKIYDGKKESRLGTKRNPAVVAVQTEERRKEISAIFEEKGWEHKIEIKPDKPEDVVALEILQNWPEPRVVDNKIGRNAPCPCGSGQKFKKCCGR